MLVLALCLFLSNTINCQSNNMYYVQRTWNKIDIRLANDLRRINSKGPHFKNYNLEAFSAIIFPSLYVKDEGKRKYKQMNKSQLHHLFHFSLGEYQLIRIIYWETILKIDKYPPFCFSTYLSYYTSAIILSWFRN